MARAFVDPEKCQGHTNCNMVAPQVFRLREEDGHSYVELDPLPEDLVELARKAMIGCPEQAITVEE